MTRSSLARLLSSAARILASALIALPAVAAGPRADYEIPPHQVFQAMIAYADEGRYDRVASILERSRILIDDLESFSGEALAKPLRAAVFAQDAWGVQSGILRMTYQHMRLEFNLAARSDSRGFARSTRLAYLDFLFLKPRLEKRSHQKAAEAEVLFRAIYERHEQEPGEDANPQFERIAALCKSAFLRE